MDQDTKSMLAAIDSEPKQAATGKTEKLQLDGSIFIDETVEWKILNKLLLPQHRNRINSIPTLYFVGLRADTFVAMQKAFIQYGIITYEGVHEYMEGKVPGQLTAATGGDLETLLSQAKRLAKKRSLKRHGDWLLSLSKQYNPDDNEINEALDLPKTETANESSLTLGTQAFLGDLHAKKNGDYVFARTGFKMTDRFMGGEYRPGGLIVLAGGAGSGKTTFWTNSAKKMAQGIHNAKTGELVRTPSLFLSLEMSQKDLILKMVADELSIDNTDLASGDFDKIANDSDYEDADAVLDAVERKAAELNELPIYVVENGKLTLAQMTYEIRRHVQKHGVRVVAIDYLQLINHHPTGNANNDLGDVAEAMKDLAKREQITIIIISQVNRAGEGLDAIRDSGEVQAVADVVVQLLPDDDPLTNTGGSTSVIFAWWKNRFGPANKKATLLFNGSYQRFDDNKSF
jgi:KaiC/GvpD/RAD55 family RecA-like ATPase